LHGEGREKGCRDRERRSGSLTSWINSPPLR
jgi:hypothetical protein